MRIVIDTNVLVSAILKDKIPEKLILFIVTQSDIEWILSEEIRNEYYNVLSRPKFNLPPSLIKQWIQIINKATIKIKPSIKISLSRDQKDTPFLECCVSANADFFITGDRDFSGAQKLINTKIVSVSQFYRIIFNSKWNLQKIK